MKNTRKILSAFLALVMAMSCFAVMGVSAAPAANKNEVSVYSGTPDTPLETADNGNTILINSADELMGFAELTATNSFSGKTVKLATDVIINKGDASKWTKDTPNLYNWICSNEWGNAFDGNFDGQGHVISGLYSKDNIGDGKNNAFFSFLRPSANRTVSNVNIVNSYFYASVNAGAIVGYLQPKAANITISIDNVYVDASVISGGEVAGGFIGFIAQDYIMNIDITNSRFDGSVSGTGRRIGGLVANTPGTIDAFNVTNCKVNASINGTKEVGGIIGSNYATMKIDGVSFDGSVTSNDTDLGGIAGNSSWAFTTIQNSNVKAFLNGVKKVGGLIGHTSETKSNGTVINNCKVDVDIKVSNERAGGLIAEVHNDSKVFCTNCDVRADIMLNSDNTWGTKSGVLIGVIQNNGSDGDNSLTISNCIVKGSVADKNANSAACVGYVLNSGKTINISISKVLVAMAQGSNVMSLTVNHKEAAGSLVFALSDIKYDSTLLANDSINGIYKGSSSASVSGNADYKAEAVATASLKGVAVFDGWTAVDGDYPTPVTATQGADIPSVENVIAYQNYGKPTTILGYQDTYENDVIKNAEDTYDLRLVATMFGENYNAVGFKDITVTYKGADGSKIGETLTQDYYYCSFIYESIKGGDEVYTADSFLCDNVFCLTIANIDADVTAIEITVTPFVADSADNITAGETVSATLNIH